MRLLSVLLLLALPTSAWPADSRRDSGDAAHLFGYYPKPGHESQFDEGYRRHLAWHRGKHDPLVWYGWYVSSGERVGMFIDGSFGAPFAAFDQRVDPAGDGADAAANFSPHAQPAFRASYRLRRDLSTGFPLEQWRPTKNVQVFHYTLRAGTSERFERAVLAAREALLRDGAAPPHSWYQLVVGGSAPGYLLLVAREDWASYDRHEGRLETLLAKSGDAAQARSLRDDLAAAVVEVKVEDWSYQADLSLIPQP